MHSKYMMTSFAQVPHWGPCDSKVRYLAAVRTGRFRGNFFVEPPNGMNLVAILEYEFKVRTSIRFAADVTLQSVASLFV